MDIPNAQGIASAGSKFLFLELVLQLQEEFIIGVFRNPVFGSHYKTANALYAFKSRGFGGEAWIITPPEIDFNRAISSKAGDN